MRNEASQRWLQRSTAMVILHVTLVMSDGCATEPVQRMTTPEVNGGGMLIDLAPANRPRMVGALDFELLAGGVGKACVDRGSVKQYWVGMADLAKLSSDELTRQAIAAAAADALGRLDDTDSILLTRVVTESKGPDRICATIVGRGVRLTKAQPTAGSGSSAP
jgi:hypothetical protein